MEQQEFLQTIQSCRRRLDLAGFLKKSIFALYIGVGAGILFQAAALITPFYYANLYAGLALLLALVSALAAALLRRCTMEQAALVIDGFGFEERVITAYERLGDDATLLRLQREDAMRQLRAHQDRIRISIWPSWKKTALLLGMCIVFLGLALMPSSTKELAKELYGIREEVREKTDEIKETIKELEQLEQEELTQDQLAALQEMIESLESSVSEYQQAASMEALKAAGDKLNYKYANMGSQLSALAQSLQSGAQTSVMTAESLQAMADKLQEMSGQESQGGDGLASGQGQQGSGNGQENGNGQGNEEGQGDGNGQGTGNGQNSQGNGEGQGDGSGEGSGRGTGSSDTSHDYVSVPNAVADSGNLTGNAASHDDSEYFRTQNGLSWEGTHVSHEAVIGSYEQNAYEGIAAGRYPSGMEEVIKDYFSSFNQ